MSAVWRTARAAVRRRRLQTTVIGLVVLFSTATIVVALGLLDASSAPFERAFAAQRGAHVVASFDSTRVAAAELTRTAGLPGVEAVAGPFPQAVLEIPPDDSALPFLSGPITVVGRADPGGPVDQIDLWAGRWATGAGEIVVNLAPPYSGRPSPFPLGERVDLPDQGTFTVVGYAYSLGQTAAAWVSPEQATALRSRTVQMLYRFGAAVTSDEIDAGLAAVTGELPSDALVAAQSYLVVKEAAAAGPGVYVPFLMVFGVLGLVAAVLIVGNVVSGAVVSGFRHIGILKALGFSPGQVLAVYLVMVCVPAVVGCVLGTVLGNLAAEPLLANAYGELLFAPGDAAVPVWVDVVALLGVPAVVVLAALVPALRAHRLPAAEAISAGGASRTGRGLRIQRWLSGSRLPRSVSLGLGLPFARPGRTALTMAAVLIGVTTVTFATGLASTVTRYADLTDGNDAVGVRPNPSSREVARSALTDPQVEALLRSLPGTTRVTVNLDLQFSLVGSTQPVSAIFLRGDVDSQSYPDQIVEGRWLAGPDEVVVPSDLLRERGLAVGDRITLALDDRRGVVTVVGETMAGAPGPSGLLTDWGTLATLAPDRQFANNQFFYQIQLAPGTDVPGYLDAVRAADPGLYAWDNGGTDEFTVAAVGLALALTLMLGTVTALGVFNTVVLNTRERRRDLGMLKSIGMTPRQVTAMMVTSMAALGAAGGLLGIPLGVVAHHLIVPLAADAAQVGVARVLLHVWQPWVLGVLAFAGVLIAMLGAFVPARAAARLSIAKVLHNE
ncbi:ABC transporter permease [Plantactinospora soyae]|uniref:ABC transport system permease protein n=1 Tax=Plantactinospora soyae TaxID=1544732 RepID=A0A927MCZ7_9ACTN|nr:FtsX-like permease family protein [Plantactinospora soyae]MBE1492438.1 putative ABC transport system permease protein [Plantactinospora soyae]